MTTRLYHRCLPGILLLTACGGGARPVVDLPAPDSTQLARMRSAASELGNDLMTLLSAELGRGGPSAAVAVCADSAQRRTARHQQAGLTVRRVGTRVRNPDNAPDSLEAAVLASFQAALNAGRLPAETVVVRRGAGGGVEARYLRPVRVMEFCLPCHGPPSRLDPGVREVLAARYPADRATGYATGDLRGAISVRLVLEAGRAD